MIDFFLAEFSHARCLLDAAYSNVWTPLHSNPMRPRSNHCASSLPQPPPYF